MVCDSKCVFIFEFPCQCSVLSPIFLPAYVDGIDNFGACRSSDEGSYFFSFSFFVSSVAAAAVFFLLKSSKYVTRRRPQRWYLSIKTNILNTTLSQIRDQVQVQKYFYFFGEVKCVRCSPGLSESQDLTNSSIFLFLASSSTGKEKKENARLPVV